MFLKRIKKKVRGTAESAVAYPRITLYVDLLFCIIILPLTILLVPVDKWFVTQPAFVVTLVIYLYLLYFVYRKVSIPSLFMRKRYGWIIMTVIMLLFVTELMTHFPLPENPHSKLPLDFRRHLHSQTVWFFFLIISGFGLAIEVTFELFRQMLARQEVEAEKNRAELAMYKAQINPHFLFNTLNNFIALNQMDEKQKLEDSLYMLADLMRYTLKAPSYVQLSDEIKFLRAYCSLQKLRFEDRLRYEIHINTEISRIKIPKLLLQPIVENSVIHGCEPAQKICTINITVSRKEEKLVIIIEDDGVGFEIKDSNIYESVGLSNIKKRLAIFSSDSRIEMTSTPGVGTRTVIYIKINEDMTL